MNEHSVTNKETTLLVRDVAALEGNRRQLSRREGVQKIHQVRRQDRESSRGAQVPQDQPAESRHCPKAR